MPNYKLKLEYNGEKFSGSQIQKESASHPERRTVQAELDKALQVFFRDSKIKSNFSSRTDTGVHAIGQVANFQIENPIENLNNNPDKFLININGILPADIAVCKIQEVPDDFHARFNAKSREYLYKIFVRKHKPVLRVDSLTWIKEPLDFDAMAKHSQKFLEMKNFKNYCKAEPYIDNFECELSRSELVQESSICFKYHIKANRFLRHMVRKIVGEMILVGKGASQEELDQSDWMAPASGLTLMKVDY